MRVSLLFAEVLLIWHAANYLASAEPKPIGYRRPAFSGIAKRSPWLLIRAAIAAVLTELIAGFGPGLPLAAAMLAG